MIVLFWSILPHIESFRSSTKRRMETAPLRRGRFRLRRSQHAHVVRLGNGRDTRRSDSSGLVVIARARRPTKPLKLPQAIDPANARTPPRGLRAARLKLSKAYIVEHSHRREISIGSVAAHFCVTPRYLQRLFEEDGITFSEFLVMQRLAHARRRLSEPGGIHVAISTIAYDCGFGDLSYFNRRFRRLYGLTPRESRGEKALCLA